MAPPRRARPDLPFDCDLVHRALQHGSALEGQIRVLEGNPNPNPNPTPDPHPAASRESGRPEPTIWIWEDVYGFSFASLIQPSLDTLLQRPEV